MNLYNIWISLSEISDKNIDLFMIFNFFWDVPVYEFILSDKNNRSSFRIRIRTSFIVRYVHTYKEFVFVTEATAVQQNNSDRTKNR